MLIYIQGTKKPSFITFIIEKVASQIETCCKNKKKVVPTVWEDFGVWIVGTLSQKYFKVVIV